MKNLLLVLLLLSQLSFTAQVVISTQGDSYSNANNTLDYTIGETIISTVTDGTNDLTQGFHQTLITIVGIEDLDPNFIVNIFPNPTSEAVSLTVEQYEGVTFHLYDIAGKLLNEALLTEKNTLIKVADYPKGTYLLNLTQVENKKIKTYKIIKK